MSLAMVTVVGRCVGTKDYNQAKYYIKKIMKITYLFTVVLVLVCSIGLIIVKYSVAFSPSPNNV